MRVKFILPALTEAHGRYWRPIKYSLFPPLGLATLAGYLDESDDDPGVFDATTQWDLARGIETATFHILTPYPGTGLFSRYAASGRILHRALLIGLRRLDWAVPPLERVLTMPSGRQASDQDVPRSACAAEPG